MYNMQALHANKRKQDTSNFAAVDEVISTGEFNPVRILCFALLF
jgi:hypothetical protein